MELNDYEYYRLKARALAHLAHWISLAYWCHKSTEHNWAILSRPISELGSIDYGWCGSQSCLLGSICRCDFVCRKGLQIQPIDKFNIVQLCLQTVESWYLDERTRPILKAHHWQIDQVLTVLLWSWSQVPQLSGWAEMISDRFLQRQGCHDTLIAFLLILAAHREVKSYSYLVVPEKLQDVMQNHCFCARSSLQNISMGKARLPATALLFQRQATVCEHLHFAYLCRVLQTKCAGSQRLILWRQQHVHKGQVYPFHRTNLLHSTLANIGCWAIDDGSKLEWRNSCIVTRWLTLLDVCTSEHAVVSCWEWRSSPDSLL